MWQCTEIAVFYCTISCEVGYLELDVINVSEIGNNYIIGRIMSIKTTSLFQNHIKPFCRRVSCFKIYLVIGEKVLNSYLGFMDFLLMDIRSSEQILEHLTQSVSPTSYRQSCGKTGQEWLLWAVTSFTSV